MTVTTQARRRENGPQANEALRIAREMVLAEERVDMRKIATQLGVNRSTLFRWVGGRDEFLGLVFWSIGAPTFRHALASVTASGPMRIAETVGNLVQALIDSAPLWAFVRASPERALRVLTTKASVVQLETVAAVEALLAEEEGRGTMICPFAAHDLAYVIVRIAESFVYSDVIAGVEPNAAKAETAIAALLSANDSSALGDLK
jgi:AcrR family transcriptional regulator